MARFSLKQVTCEMPLLARSFRWFLVLAFVPLILLSACGPQPHATHITNNSLYGIAVVSPTDIWAVGNISSSRETSLRGQILIEQWNDRHWQTVSTSLDGSLAGIAAIASNDIWAVGASLGSLLTMHWNGSRWSQVANPADHGRIFSALSAVGAVSSHDAWAVGNLENMPVILHWDGQHWLTAPLNLSSFVRDGALDAIQVISAHDIWAVGWYSKPNFSARYTLAEQWDGKNWRFVPTPAYTVGSSPDRQSLNNATFSSLVALSGTNIWAIGNSDLPSVHPSLMLVEHWDGKQWKVVDTPAAAQTDASYLQNIFAVNAYDIWIAGYRYSRVTETTYPLLLHWDGQSWQFATPPALKNVSCEFYAGAALAANDLWVVGSSSGVVSPAPTLGDNIAQTLVEHWNGTGWTHVFSPSPGESVTVGSA